MPLSAPALVAIAALCLAVAGCAPKHGLDPTEPTGQIGAIRSAATGGEEASIPRLIELLDSDDPAVRLFTIGALEDITGERFGYDPAAPTRDRRDAVDRWAAWYAARSGQAAGGAAPSPGPAIHSSSLPAREAGENGDGGGAARPAPDRPREHDP